MFFIIYIFVYFKKVFVPNYVTSRHAEETAKKSAKFVHGRIEQSAKFNSRQISGRTVYTSLRRPNPRHRARFSACVLCYVSCSRLKMNSKVLLLLAVVLLPYKSSQGYPDGKITCECNSGRSKYVILQTRCVLCVLSLKREKSAMTEDMSYSLEK